MIRTIMVLVMMSFALPAMANTHRRFEGAFNEGASKRECVRGLAETLAYHSVLGHLTVTDITKQFFADIYKIRAEQKVANGINAFWGSVRVRVEPQYSRKTGRRLGYVCSVRTDCEKAQKHDRNSWSATEYKLINGAGQIVDTDRTLFCGSKSLNSK